MKKKELEAEYNKLMLEKRYEEIRLDKLHRSYCGRDILSILQFRERDKDKYWEIIECEFYGINWTDRKIIFNIKNVYTPVYDK